MSELHSESTPRETVDELPFAGRVVAYVLLAIGVAGVLKLVAGFYYDSFNVNLVDFACLYVGWGLLKGRDDAPGCATSLIGCLGIGFCLALVAAVVMILVAWSLGESPEFHVHPSPLYAVACIALFAGFAYWSHGVLKRPEVRAYCDGRRKRFAFRRFRLEHMLALMTMIAYAAVGLSPASKDQAPRIISGGFATVAQNAAPIRGLYYEVLESDSSQRLLHVVLVKGSAGKGPASSLEMWNEALVLEVQGNSYTLRQDARVHIYDDGRLYEGVERITQAQWDAYRSTKPQQWSIEEIEAFLKDRVTEAAP